MNLIQLVMGDYSGDGHEKTYVETYQCSHTKDKVIQAYRASTENIVGFDFITEVADGYEEPCISPEQLEKLYELGLVSEEEYNDLNQNEYSGKLWIDTELYVQVFWNIVAMSIPDIEYKYVNIPQLNIGGYGLV